MIKIPYKELMEMEDTLFFFGEYYKRNLPPKHWIKRWRYRRELAHAREVLEEAIGQDTTIIKRDLLAFCDFAWKYYSLMDPHHKFRIQLSEDNCSYIMWFDNHILDNVIHISISRDLKDMDIDFCIEEGGEEHHYIVKTIRTNSMNVKFVHDTMLRLLYDAIGGDLSNNRKFQYLFRNPNLDNPIRINKDGQVEEIFN